MPITKGERGTLRRVKSLLLEQGPLSCAALAEALQVDEHRLYSLLYQAVTRSGGMVIAGYEGRSALYDVYRVREKLPRPVAASSGVRCPPPYATGYRWRI